MNDWVVSLTLAAAALAGIVSIVWQLRARSARRWLTALNAYAEREIAREMSSPRSGSEVLPNRLAN